MTRKTRARMRWAKFVVLCPLTVSACGPETADRGGTEESASHTHALGTPVASFPSTAVRHWMASLANAARDDQVTPPVASRTYAYGAIAMYEALVHGMPGHHSMVGQLNGLTSLPLPEAGADYDWPTVLAATMHRVQRDIHIFPFLEFHEFVTPSMAALGTLGPVQIGHRRIAGVAEDVIDRSEAYGASLGEALAAWANADGYPDDVRFAAWEPPRGPDKWVPTGFADTDKVARAIEPHFGRLRTLVLTDGSECLAPPPPEFSTDPASAMYQEALAVYTTDLELTQEQRTIALFWADGPGTSGPPGHWVEILNTLIRNESMADAVVAHMKMGIGQYDAFVSTWYSKYYYNLLRPTTYIRRHIDPTWRSFIPAPQFPEYTSGHSGQSGAATTVLAAVLGDVPFTDTTKVRRGFEARSYASFT
jgi:hypothetical protein